MRPLVLTQRPDGKGVLRVEPSSGSLAVPARQLRPRNCAPNSSPTAVQPRVGPRAASSPPESPASCLPEAMGTKAHSMSQSSRVARIDQRLASFDFHRRFDPYPCDSVPTQAMALVCFESPPSQQELRCARHAQTRPLPPTGAARCSQRTGQPGRQRMT